MKTKELEDHIKEACQGQPVTYQVGYLEGFQSGFDIALFIAEEQIKKINDERVKGTV